MFLAPGTFLENFAFFFNVAVLIKHFIKKLKQHKMANAQIDDHSFPIKL